MQPFDSIGCRCVLHKMKLSGRSQPSLMEAWQRHRLGFTVQSRFLAGGHQTGTDYATQDGVLDDGLGERS